jgi:hypothetical protein
MSGGCSCKCEQSRKPLSERTWVVLQRNCNHSAFSGYRRTPSRYSSVRCTSCRTVWRTAAVYVEQLKDAK